MTAVPRKGETVVFKNGRRAQVDDVWHYIDKKQVHCYITGDGWS